MADQCTEGHRKKAKYLLDEEELREWCPYHHAPILMAPSRVYEACKV